MKGTTIGRLAYCHDCSWTCDARNAQGLASQHAERREHRVAVETLIHYDGRPDGEKHEQLVVTIDEPSKAEAALKASLDAVRAQGYEIRAEGSER